MAFSYYKAITIDHTKCGSANSTDFPVLISRTDADLKVTGSGGHVTNSNGYDIAFYSDSALTTALSFELERYVSTTGEIQFWVKVPTLSSSVDTVIYMAYGDSGITTNQSSTSTWSSSFQAVYHLKDGTTLSGVDSTANAYNGTVSGATATTGQIDGGASFNGTSNYISTSASVRDAAQTISLSIWVYPTSGGTYPGIMVKGSAWNENSSKYAFEFRSSGQQVSYFQAGLAGINSATVIALNTWTKLDIVNDATDSRLYVNGALDTTGTSRPAPTTSADTWKLGAYVTSGGSGFWQGRLDEARVYNVRNTTSWITASYNNENSPSTFYSVGTETSAGGGTPFIADQFIYRQAVNRASTY